MKRDLKRFLKDSSPLLLLIGLALLFLILWVLGGIFVRLLKFVLLILGTTTLVLFISIFIQNYGRYNDAEKALKKSVEEMKKLYYAFLDLIFGKG